MTICEDTDFMFPMKADVYYPIITQGEYGQPKRIGFLIRLYLAMLPLLVERDQKI